MLGCGAACCGGFVAKFSRSHPQTGVCAMCFRHECVGSSGAGTAALTMMPTPAPTPLGAAAAARAAREAVAKKAQRHKKLLWKQRQQIESAQERAEKRKRAAALHRLEEQKAERNTKERARKKRVAAEAKVRLLRR